MRTFETPLDHGPVRLRLGAAAGILGALFIAARVLLASHFDERQVAQAIRWAGQHPVEAFAVNLCETLGFGLIAFSCITVTGLVRGRGKWLTQIGGWGTCVSYLIIAFNSVGAVIAAQGDNPDQAAATSTVQHFMHSGQAALTLAGLVSSALWPLLFGAGLSRSGLVGWWYAGLVLIWTVLQGVLSSTGPVALLGTVVPLALVVAVWAQILWNQAGAMTSAVIATETRAMA